MHTLLIAERSEANNRDLWASESQLAFIYISVRHAFPASGGKPRVQNGDSDSYTDAVFEFLAQKEAEIWTSLLSSKAYYSSQVSRVCVAIL